MIATCDVTTPVGVPDSAALLLLARLALRAGDVSGLHLDDIDWDRAGIRGVGPTSSHLFRHSAAMNLLRDGAPLEALGTLLRNRSPDTTAIYARVDVRMLRELVQPWPYEGEAR